MDEKMLRRCAEKLGLRVDEDFMYTEAYDMGGLMANLADKSHIRGIKPILATLICKEKGWTIERSDNNDNLFAIYQMGIVDIESYDAAIEAVINAYVKDEPELPNLDKYDRADPFERDVATCIKHLTAEVKKMKEGK